MADNACSATTRTATTPLKCFGASSRQKMQLTLCSCISLTPEKVPRGQGSMIGSARSSSGAAGCISPAGSSKKEETGQEKLEELGEVLSSEEAKEVQGCMARASYQKPTELQPSRTKAGSRSKSHDNSSESCS